MSTKQSPPRRRSPLMAVLLVLALVVAIVAALVIQRWRGIASRESLQGVLAELDETEPGWRLADIEAMRGAKPRAGQAVENSALVVAAVGPLLPYFEPNYALVNVRSNERLADAFLDKHRKALGSGELHLASARRLADMPHGQFAVKLEPWHALTLNEQLEHHHQAWRVSNVLAFDAVDRAHAGDVSGALTSCRAALNAGRSLGDEPMLWPQMMRSISGDAIGRVAVYCLALGVADEKSLAELQRLAALELQVDCMLCGWRGKRALLGAFLEGIDNGTIRLRDVPNGDRLRRSWLWPDRQIHIDQAALLRLAKKITDTAQLPIHEQPAAFALLQKELNPETASTWLADEFFPNFGTPSSSNHIRDVPLGCLVILLAAERYRLKHDKWPERIDDLMPDYLTEVPIDPFDGKPLRFKRLPDGVAAYSVGDDGIDDGGNMDLVGVPGGGKDRGYRLWDVSKRNQPARPPKKAKK